MFVSGNVRTFQTPVRQLAGRSRAHRLVANDVVARGALPVVSERSFSERVGTHRDNEVTEVPGLRGPPK